MFPYQFLMMQNMPKKFGGINLRNTSDVLAHEDTTKGTTKGLTSASPPVTALWALKLI